MKKALVLGAGGFIGSHMVKRLKAEGYWVCGVDLKYPEFSDSLADDFVIADLRNFSETNSSIVQTQNEFSRSFDEIYQFAADMGGAAYIFSGENDADIMQNSATINLNVLRAICRGVERKEIKKPKIFYSSSACVYPKRNQLNPDNPNCSEDSAYPADPDSEYGWEKLFSERIFFAYNRNYGLPVYIARLHNVFGPEGAWKGGKEKAPAAICRKVAETEDGGEIEVWGDGEQTRSFLYIDECIEGIRRFIQSDFQGPMNIGSEEMITINDLASIVAKIGGKAVSIRHTDGPQGVRGRSSDNRLIQKELKWAPTMKLSDGLSVTYAWIRDQLEKSIRETVQ